MHNMGHNIKHGDLKVPTYPILSKRGKKLDLKDSFEEIKKLKNEGEKINIIVDSTGIKVCGENECKVRTHGKGKKRKWVKLHAAIDKDTRQIVSSTVTDNDTHDGKEFCEIIK